MARDGRFWPRLPAQVPGGDRPRLASCATWDEAAAALDAALKAIAAGADPRSIGSKEALASYVYFIRNKTTDAIKIGRAKNPTARLYAVQTDACGKLELLCVLPGGPRLEATLHAAFADARKIREWFDPTKEMLALIEELKGIWSVTPPSGGA
jgi:hypothetical protein